MAHVNILKQVKSGDRWRLVAIPRNKKGGYDWEALPTDATSSNGTSVESESAKPAARQRLRRRKWRAVANTCSKAGL